MSPLGLRTAGCMLWMQGKSLLGLHKSSWRFPGGYWELVTAIGCIQVFKPHCWRALHCTSVHALFCDCTIIPARLCIPFFVSAPPLSLHVCACPFLSVHHYPFNPEKGAGWCCCCLCLFVLADALLSVICVPGHVDTHSCGVLVTLLVVWCVLEL